MEVKNGRLRPSLQWGPGAKPLVGAATISLVSVVWLPVLAGAAAEREVRGVLGSGPPTSTCGIYGNRADPVTLSEWWGSRGHLDP